jgi:hypothetical protein
MDNLSEHSRPPLHRRSFISKSIKLALLAGVLSPLEQACNTKSKKTTKKDPKDKSPSAKKTNRKKWNAEKLVVNTKTNVIHLPTAAFYVYYDEIKKTKDVNIADWENQTQGVKFNKDKSGNILEILSLQKLKKGINDSSLNSAMNVLAMAFSKDCENSKGVNSNITNYRLHELMLQIISLNNFTPFKWKTFNDMVRIPQRLGKRQSWMANENSFNDRVKYIKDREADYKNRLLKRASKYTLI